MKFNEPKPQRTLALYFMTLILLCGQWNTCVGADKELWVYCPANFLVDSECKRVHETMERAAKAGYTHFLVSDSKFSRLVEMESKYFDHLEELQSKAASLKLTLVPTCCHVGYSNDILSLNPNLAEGLPVRRSLYRVKGDQAVHVPDPNVSLPSLTDRKQWGFIDDVFVASENGLVASAPFGAHARIMKSIQTQKFQQYHASVWIKTENFTPQVEIKVLDRQSHGLSYTYLNAKPTQDWTQHHITFNSLDNDQLNFYIGVWGPKTGKLWLRDPKLESTGAVNMVRRPTAPTRVQWIDGTNSVDLKENIDFEPWADPKLGQTPYRGEYQSWHEPPPIKLKRQLPPGSELEVSYFHTHIIHESQVCGSIGDPEFEELLRQQVAVIGKTIPADAYMMMHDEYRVMGWTEHSIAALPNTASPGDLLTHNAKVCFQAILQSNPQARALIWSDMFDPHHNAVAKYYLVNGSLESSKLPKEVVVMNWNSGKKRESLEHFHRLGHRQIIAGYYDESPDQIRDWLDVVMDNQIENVDGVMYTTWVKDYADLEAFATSVRSHRWYK
jgi:hypothetical protein